jgi:hypothetical protein
MKFLAVSEAIEVGPLLQPQQTLQILDQRVIPSLQILAGWESDGKSTGGTFVAQRGGAIILEADSVEQAHQMLSSLPFWGLTTWSVRPLVPTGTALEGAQQQAQRIRSMVGG